MTFIQVIRYFALMGAGNSSDSWRRQQRYTYGKHSKWGYAVILVWSDAVLRRRLVAIAAICTLWMIEVVVKYKSFTQAYTSLLWYLYYVPMTFIPLLFQLCGFRLAGLELPRLASVSRCYWP